MGGGSVLLALLVGIGGLWTGSREEPPCDHVMHGEIILLQVVANGVWRCTVLWFRSDQAFVHGLMGLKGFLGIDWYGSSIVLAH